MGEELLSWLVSVLRSKGEGMIKMIPAVFLAIIFSSNNV